MEVIQILSQQDTYPAKIYLFKINMFKVNNKDTSTTSWRRSGVFILNFEHISHLFLVFLLLTLNK